MTGQVAILNFDHVYVRQSFYRRVNYEWVDFSDLAGVRGYCDAAAQRIISRRLKQRRCKGITFIGSGNYHYVTYLLLQETQVPFTLVLFDRHVDMMPAAGELLSCGSWVWRALTDLECLKYLVVIGAGPEQLDFIPPDLAGKVLVLPASALRPEPVTADGVEAAIPTRQVYLSIDKDVLRRRDAVTDWEQGPMTLEQLLYFLQRIGEGKEICGVDVCGELPVSWADDWVPQNRWAAARNNRANAKILDLVLSLVKKKAYLTAG